MGSIELRAIPNDLSDLRFQGYDIIQRQITGQ